VAASIRDKTFHIETSSDFKFSCVLDYLGKFTECEELSSVSILSKPVDKLKEMTCVESVKSNIEAIKKDAMKLIIEANNTLLRKEWHWK
jgi:hypothetical protein